MELVGMILCAGLGTRLRPLTEVVPKPAVPVCGVPLVRWNLALLARAGVRRAVVNTHHLAEPMAAAAREAARALGIELAVSHERVIAGTGGALRQARPHLEGADAIVLVNGDVLFDVDLAEAVRVHRWAGGRATMVLAPMPPGARYAAVEVDGSGWVRRIAGKFGPGRDGEGLRPFHFTGVHVLSPGLLDDVPSVPFECDINRQVYPRAMERAGGVRGFLQGGYWNDLGTPERYLAANLDVLDGTVPLGRFGLDPLAGFTRGEEGAAIHPSAAVQGSVARAFVGAGARLAPGCTVREAVIWAGTEIGAGERVERTIAAAEMRVQAF